MKISKMRAKARSAFKRWTSLCFRTDDGQIWPFRPGPLLEPEKGPPVTEVVIIRGRAFSRPQTELLGAGVLAATRRRNRKPRPRV